METGEKGKEGKRVDIPKETKITSAGRGVVEIEVGEVGERNCYEQGGPQELTFTCKHKYSPKRFLVRVCFGRRNERSAVF